MFSCRSYRSDRDEYVARTMQILEIFEELCGSPSVRRVLAQEENFQHLCQLTLTHDPHIVSKVLDILMDVLEVSPVCRCSSAISRTHELAHFLLPLQQLVPTLYRTGIFAFLMLHIGSEINNVVCTFLAKYHALQQHEDREAQPMYLSYFFPGPVVGILGDPDGARRLASLMREGESQAPDLFWNRELLARTVSTVETVSLFSFFFSFHGLSLSRTFAPFFQFLEPFLTNLRTNPLTLYQYSTPPTIAYPGKSRVLLSFFHSAHTHSLISVTSHTKSSTRSNVSATFTSASTFATQITPSLTPRPSSWH